VFDEHFGTSMIRVKVRVCDMARLSASDESKPIRVDVHPLSTLYVSEHFACSGKSLINNSCLWKIEVTRNLGQSPT